MMIKQNIFVYNRNRRNVLQGIEIGSAQPQLRKQPSIIRHIFKTVVEKPDRNDVKETVKDSVDSCTSNISKKDNDKPPICIIRKEKESDIQTEVLKKDFGSYLRQRKSSRKKSPNRGN